MLHKQPAARPTAIEVRQAARTIARELSQAYEDASDASEATGLSPIEPRQAQRRSPPAYKVQSDEVVVIDADELEFGVTEMLPVVRQPRWTPEIADLPGVFVESRSAGAISPRAARDQVAGEIIASDKDH
jgi:hypothetical protein